MTNSVAPHILMLDDDAAICELVAEYLGNNEMRVTCVHTGSAMFAALEAHAVDLVLLDLKLPGEDGLQLARQVRERATVPIILLTGRNEEADRVMGLELGADDYLTKPFSPRELLARIRALLRRTRMYETVAEKVDHIRIYRFPGWELNLRTRQLTRNDGNVVPLRNGEFNLLL